MNRKPEGSASGPSAPAVRSIATVATAAAASLAAAAVAASIVLSPVADAPARMDGVHADLLRAVQLNQITEEQAVKFEAKLTSRILGEA